MGHGPTTLRLSRNGSTRLLIGIYSLFLISQHQAMGIKLTQIPFSGLPCAVATFCSRTSPSSARGSKASLNAEPRFCNTPRLECNNALRWGQS
ncbi:hypothetical protein C8Q74DRAFT_47984 [Fomes fomentarius]|nr:hypothetical protein C8Q74DRAFT_47984 [Fomes fomentarius]